MPSSHSRPVPVLLLCLLAGSVCCAFARTLPDISKVGALPSAPTPSITASASLAATQQSHVTIPRLESEPTLSDFLVNPVHSQAARAMLRISNFVERYPKDGAPVTEPTVAYLGYTREYLFAAFVCKDKKPDLIRGHMLARDSLGDDDAVEVMLDTFNDQRRAFLFRSNALGIQADGLYSEQNGTDYSFDTVWDTWGKRTQSGYVVLLRIPFSSLYFAKAAAGRDPHLGNHPAAQHFPCQ